MKVEMKVEMKFAPKKTAFCSPSRLHTLMVLSCDPLTTTETPATLMHETVLVWPTSCVTHSPVSTCHTRTT